MTDEAAAPRSRRALLTAAAGAAGALAASAVMPLTAAAADPNDVVMGVDNPTTATTSITNSNSGSTAFAGAATDDGFGIQGTSTGGAGVLGWSVSAPGAWFTSATTAYTGVFGSAPAGPTADIMGTGVYGDSEDVGVFGYGGTGVYGLGAIGVYGESTSASAGVLAVGRSATDVALEVQGKVKFSRSGRSTIGSGKKLVTVTLAGVSTSSRIFAVLHTNRTGRWVQSVVPASGKFTINLNGTVSASTYVAWFVLN